MAASMTSPATLQHLVHKADDDPTNHHHPPEDLGGMVAPPALGGRTISPTTSGSPPGSTSSSGMTSVNWGGMPQDTTSLMVVPTFPTKATGNPVVIASAGIRLDTTSTTNANTTTPTFSVGSANPSSPRSSSGTTTKRRKGDGQAASKDGAAPNNRRQKRLERNRESARLSRRRRKQYLEVLEDRVSKLSLEMDKGRREHVFVAMDTIKAKRDHIMASGGSGAPLSLLYSVMSRTSTELRVASTFQTQQLQSLSLPPNVKFLLWLTLQNDSYFRGGRAASERLSAARIGERMLTCGNDTVPPSHGMWPLLCNEVGLSYDQEERIRSFQRNLLLSHDSWVHRHAGAASKLAMDSTHDCLQASMNAVSQRESGVFGCLTELQQLKFLQWAAKNTDRLAKLKQKKMKPVVKREDNAMEFSAKHHIAANLYILHHRMQQTIQSLPPIPSLVSGSSLKRLARRPSFESLGSSGIAEKNSKDNSSRPLSREVSFSSEGSLKRSLDDMNSLDKGDEDRHTVHSINPEEAQTAAGPAVEAALGFIKELVPPPRPPPKLAAPDKVSSSFVMPAAFKIPATRQQTLQDTSAPHQTYAGQQVQVQQPQQQVQQFSTTQAATGGTNPLSPGMYIPVTYTSDQVPPFLPPNLNVVPEEGFLPGGSGSADDFLFDLTAEDWAIGAGLDMDTA